MGDMLEYERTAGGATKIRALREQCERTVARLVQDSPVQELDALPRSGTSAASRVVSKAVLDAIDRDELEGGLDRLHTFVVKYVRSLCDVQGIAVDHDKPLHSLSAGT